MTTVSTAHAKRTRSNEETQRKRQAYEDKKALAGDGVHEIEPIAADPLDVTSICGDMPGLTIEDWLIVDPTNLALLDKGRSMLLEIDGDVQIRYAPSTLEGMQEILSCKNVQMVPISIGPYAGMFELWIDEEGYYAKAFNQFASDLFGEQVFGGRLHGVVMVMPCTDGPP